MRHCCSAEHVSPWDRWFDDWYEPVRQSFNPKEINASSPCLLSVWSSWESHRCLLPFTDNPVYSYKLTEAPRLVQSASRWSTKHQWLRWPCPSFHPSAPRKSLSGSLSPTAFVWLDTILRNYTVLTLISVKRRVWMRLNSYAVRANISLITLEAGVSCRLQRPH